MSETAIIDWDEGKLNFQRKIGNFVHYFQVNLPANAHGIPMQLINPTVIAEGSLYAENPDDVDTRVVDKAIWDIEYEDGLPVIGGTPIWERLEGETIDYYNLFKKYRDGLYHEGSRAIAKIADKVNIAGRFLSALAKVYHWQLRCHAYDMWKKVEFQRQRQKEIEVLEARHAKAAETMLQKGMRYLEEHPEQMNAKVAVQLIQTAVKVGRLAVGLNPEKPGLGDAGPSVTVNNVTNPGTPMETSTSVEVGPGGNGQPGKTPSVSHLQSILHILDQSGALDKVKILDAEYEVVNEDDGVVSA